MTIWFASGNAHKKAELASILADSGCGYELVIPADAGLEFDPEETEETFHGNAILKARALRRLLLEARPPLFRDGDPIVADDSGICVDALDGRPGVYSARYSGPPGSPVSGKPGAGERNAMLLGELGDAANRTARFVCAMVLLFGHDTFFVAQETLEGEIVKGPGFATGAGGFGYDPIFWIPGLGRTAAELSGVEKNAVSHRGKAGRLIARMLERRTAD